MCRVMLVEKSLTNIFGIHSILPVNLPIGIQIKFHFPFFHQFYRMDANFKQKLNYIKAFAFDMDGVLTDGSLIVREEEEPLRIMDIKDGLAIHKAVDNGYKIIVITGSSSEAVKKRLNYLGVTEVYAKAKEKEVILKQFAEAHHLSMQEILYMGDDLPDLEPMKMAGIAACPYDAVPEIREISMYISDKHGGKGCVRDVIRQVMKLQNKW
jgi:3-deoxy-D-manno-octulosonate 8-phosphate phosphatase (KDO 8-P phosphatase)